MLYLGNYSEDRIAFKGNSQYEIEKRNITFATIEIELGKQWVFGDKFLIDTYWRIGYAADNKKK